MRAEYCLNFGEATLDTWLLKSSERDNSKVVLSHGPQSTTLRFNVSLPLEALGKLLGD
jgi:hypothetical protein